MFRPLSRDTAPRFGCAIHAYVLMTNHVHLLMTPREGDGISRMMQYVGRRYVPYVNHLYQRSGTLWEGRFKASLIQTEVYLLLCHRYIELNPVRAGMVEAPGDFPWSSYRHNALGVPDPLLTPHAEYQRLGSSDEARRAAYRGLFRGRLEPRFLKQMQGCLQTGTPLGNDRFREEIARTLGCRVGYAARGRPRKAPDDGEGANVAPDGQLPIDGL